MLEVRRPDECCNTAPGLSINRIRGAIMPAHRKYFNLPESKTCPECGADFPRPASYGHQRWFKAELCGLSCASKRGTRLKAERRTAEFTELFDRHVDRTSGQGPEGGCWQWTGDRCVKGYGRIGYQCKSLKAHRIALFGLADYFNPLMACHRCDNPACVRPSHLFAGTALDNTTDKMVKGRHRGNQKLGSADVRAIRADSRTHAEIAQEYGVSPSNVGAIKQRLTWKAA